MNRYIYSFIIALVLTGCGQNKDQHKDAAVTENATQPEVQQQPLKADTLPGNADTGTMHPASAPAAHDAAQTNCTDFNAFYQNFRNAVGKHSMQSLTGFVNFPFDEQDGLWTKAQFINSFQLATAYVRLIRTALPFKKKANEYWLNGDDGGLIFKKNKQGCWKWFSIYYAE